jgi:uncharacterized protein (TIGR02145 family)
MLSSNLGLTKTIFRQATAPAVTDVLWYDTINNVFKYFHIPTLTWTVLYRSQLSGTLTATTPTSAQITTVIGLTPVQVGAGFQVTILNTTDSLLYQITSDGTSWFYRVSIKNVGVTDANGNEYNKVIVGAQTWLVEPLKATKYADGTSIPILTSNASWDADTAGACCYYNNDPVYAEVYGLMYNWYAVHNAHGIAPAGYHVATNADWEALIASVGGWEHGGGSLKEVGIAHWSINNGATNSTGFTAVPGGQRQSNNGAFNSLGDYGVWWSADSYSVGKARAYYILGYYDYITQGNFDKPMGFSVHCVKD